MPRYITVTLVVADYLGSRDLDSVVDAVVDAVEIKGFEPMFGSAVRGVSAEAKRAGADPGSWPLTRVGAYSHR